MYCRKCCGRGSWLERSGAANAPGLQVLDNPPGCFEHQVAKTCPGEQIQNVMKTVACSDEHLRGGFEGPIIQHLLARIPRSHAEHGEQYGGRQSSQHGMLSQMPQYGSAGALAKQRFGRSVHRSKSHSTSTVVASCGWSACGLVCNCPK